MNFRTHSLREPSCPLRRRREWATRSSGFATWGHHRHDQVGSCTDHNPYYWWNLDFHQQRMEGFVSSPRFFLSQQEERGWGNKNTSTSCSESRFNRNSSQPHFVIWKYITFYFRVLLWLASSWWHSIEMQIVLMIVSRPYLVLLCLVGCLPTVGGSRWGWPEDDEDDLEDWGEGRVEEQGWGYGQERR